MHLGICFNRRGFEQNSHTDGYRLQPPKADFHLFRLWEFAQLGFVHFDRTLWFARFGNDDWWL